jgi:putative sigma-54 modulation protein
MTIEKLMHKVEATVHLAGKDLFYESSSEDMYAAIDELAHKLDRAIIKHKEKTLTHRHDSVSLKSESIE